MHATSFAQYSFTIVKCQIKNVFAFDERAQFTFATLVAQYTYADKMTVRMVGLKRFRLTTRVKFECISIGNLYFSIIVCQQSTTRLFYSHFTHFNDVQIFAIIEIVKQIMYQQFRIIFDAIKSGQIFVA